MPFVILHTECNKARLNDPWPGEPGAIISGGAALSLALASLPPATLEALSLPPGTMMVRVSQHCRGSRAGPK
jgi:hypothetical protein